MQIWFFVKYLIDFLCYRIISKLFSMVYTVFLRNLAVIEPARSLGELFAWQVILPSMIGSSSGGHEKRSLLKTFSHTDIGWTWKKAPPTHPSSQSLHLMASGGFLQWPSYPTAHVALPGCSKALRCGQTEEKAGQLLPKRERSERKNL